MIKAIFFDLSGVLYSGSVAIDGAVNAVSKARRHDLQLRFVTNTSRIGRQQIVNDLLKLGFNLNASELYTAADAAKRYVIQQGLRPYCLLHKDIQAGFADLPQHQPNAVLVGDAEHDFTYQHLNQAFQLCHAGAPLIAIGKNRYFKLDGALQLDAGAFVHAIEYAASCTATIIGKPSKTFFQQIVQTTTVMPNETLMIGDDVFGDVEGALVAGLNACLVKTGKYQHNDEHQLDKEICCCASVGEAVDLALAQRFKVS
jgi:HAD superfamily hydrolase (TIGR01458 family)